MTQRGGRVTILPEQVRRLAELSESSNCAIEIVQNGGSVLHLSDGTTKFSVDARGNTIQNANQDTLC